MDTGKGQGKDLVTQWQPPRLAPSLQAAVDTDGLWDGVRPLPVLTDGERSNAEQALQVYRSHPRGSSPGAIAKMVGTAALGYPAARLSAEEADIRLKLYQGELGDIDRDILAQAFSIAVRTLKFFPSIAELREIARKVPPPRRYVVAGRLKALIANRPPEPVEYVSAGEVQALARRLGGTLHV